MSVKQAFSRYLKTLPFNLPISIVAQHLKMPKLLASLKVLANLHISNGEYKVDLNEFNI